MVALGTGRVQAVDCCTIAEQNIGDEMRLPSTWRVDTMSSCTRYNPVFNLFGQLVRTPGAGHTLGTGSYPGPETG